MLQSQRDYKECLKQNIENPQRCAAYKEIYRTDLKTYRTISNQVGKVLSDRSISSTVTITDER